MNVVGFVFYGENLREGGYYNRRYYKNYYRKYDYRNNPAAVSMKHSQEKKEETSL